MTCDECVGVALGGFGITGQPAKGAQSLHGGIAAGEDLVGITLVAHVKHQPVPAGIKYAMNGNDQLYRPQTGGQMAAGAGDHIQDAGPQQTAESSRLTVGQGAEIVGTLLQTKNGNTSR